VTALIGAGCGRSGSDARITASGYVEATEVRVSSKVGGIIAALPIDEGSRVESGALIAEIDQTDLRLALQAAQGEAALAEAEWRLRKAGSRVEDIATAAAQTRRAEADLRNATADLDRMEGLLASGSGTTKGRDDARLRRDTCIANLDQAREQFRKLQTGSRPEEIDAAAARLAASRARVEQLEQQMRDAVVRSPIAGLVTEKLMERGELAAKGAALAVVTDMRDIWLNVYVSEIDLARLRIGQSAEVETDDHQRREGTIVAIASQAEFTPKNVQTRDERVKLVYKVKIRLKNEDGLFKPGMPAEARISPAASAS
jgi:HlyD family secretion protein